MPNTTILALWVIGIMIGTLISCVGYSFCIYYMMKLYSLNEQQLLQLYIETYSKKLDPKKPRIVNRLIRDVQVVWALVKIKE